VAYGQVRHAGTQAELGSIPRFRAGTDRAGTIVVPLRREHPLDESRVRKTFALVLKAASLPDAGLLKTMEDALQLLRHASQPLEPMGAE